MCLHHTFLDGTRKSKCTNTTYTVYVLFRTNMDSPESFLSLQSIFGISVNVICFLEPICALTRVRVHFFVSLARTNYFIFLYIKAVLNDK